jgi:hypothetical protein
MELNLHKTKNMKIRQIRIHLVSPFKKRSINKSIKINNLKISVGGLLFKMGGSKVRLNPISGTSKIYSMQCQLQGMGSSVVDLDVCGCNWQICAVRNGNRAGNTPQKFHFSDNGMDLGFSSIGIDCSNCNCACGDEWPGVLGAG